MQGKYLFETFSNIQTFFHEFLKKFQFLASQNFVNTRSYIPFDISSPLMAISQILKSQPKENH